MMLNSLNQNMFEFDYPALGSKVYPAKIPPI